MRVFFIQGSPNRVVIIYIHFHSWQVPNESLCGCPSLLLLAMQAILKLSIRGHTFSKIGMLTVLINDRSTFP